MDVREACIQEALAIIEDKGVENLSLRQVSRRLGISHQAPYKHFPSRDHILAEIIKRAFDAFGAYLDENPVTDNPHADLDAMGRAYVHYAMAHPLHYRLMFNTQIQHSDDYPDLQKSAQYAFHLLQDCLKRLYGTDTPAALRKAELDALFIWSTMHGLSGILYANSIEKLNLSTIAEQAAIDHVLSCIGRAIGRPG